jgi:Bacteriocin-protection, YdeI or OmpD-Associated/Domain of unknown function (DUF1905)
MVYCSIEVPLEKYPNGYYLLFVPQEFSTLIALDGQKRVVCNFNEKLTVHRALFPRKEGGAWIMISKTIIKELKLEVGDIVKLTLERDVTEFQAEVAEELTAALEMDPEAKAVFDSLTKGNQRSLIYMIIQTKSEHKKIEKALHIIECLKMGITRTQDIMKARNKS